MATVEGLDGVDGVDGVVGVVENTDANVECVKAALEALEAQDGTYKQALRDLQKIPGIKNFKSQVLLNNLALLGLAPACVLRDADCVPGKPPHKLLKQLPSRAGQTIEVRFERVIVAVGPGEHRRGIEDTLCELHRAYSPKGIVKNWVYVPALQSLRAVLARHNLLPGV